MRALFRAWLEALRGSQLAGIWPGRGALRDSASLAELRLLNERLDLTQMAAGVTSWEWDIEADEITWTAGQPNLVRLRQATRIKYDDVIAVIHPEDRQATRDAAAWAAAHDKTFQIEFRIPMPDGTVRWLLSRGKVSSEGTGKFRRMLGVNVDITERKLLESSIREDRERFRAIFDQAAVGVGYVPLMKTFQIANQKLCDMFGYSHDEITTKTVLDLIHPDDRGTAAQIRDRLIASGGQDATDEGRLIRRDGTQFWGEITASRVLLEGSASFLVIMIKDITKRIEAENVAKRATEEMKLAMRAADAANQAKTYFLANMSHEIRTPLTAILGFSELLRLPASSEGERLNYVETIVRNGHALSRLINDILDLSKIEASHFEIVRSRVLVRPLIDHLRATISGLVGGRPVELRFHCDDKVPETLFTDGAKLMQLLVNVVGNAVKFTPAGAVDLRVSLEPGTGGARLVFTVTDSGIGMTAAVQQSLFQPFSQGDASTTRTYGGTGLGLALSRRLTRLLGGDLVLVSSEPGKGSTFVATLPLALASEPDLAPPDGKVKPQAASGELRPSLEGVRVLLVEDSPDSRAYLSLCLKRGGIEVQVAGNGQEAIALALASEFDLILMDIQLPIMDGLEATQRLRSLGCRTSIVALTAHAFDNERQRCLQAGCDAHLSKPIRPDELLGFVAEFVRMSRTRQ